MGGVTTEGRKKWKPSREDVRYMTLYTMGICALLVVSFVFMIGWLKSVRRIYGVGGNGWERKNYLMVMREKYSLEASDELERYKEQYKKELLPAKRDEPPSPNKSPTSLSIMSFLLGNHHQDTGYHHQDDGYHHQDDSHRTAVSHLQNTRQNTSPREKAKNTRPNGDRSKRGNAFATTPPEVPSSLSQTGNVGTQNHTSTHPHKFRRWLSRKASVQQPLTTANITPTKSPTQDIPADTIVVDIKPSNNKNNNKTDGISGVSTIDDDDEVSRKSISDWF
ncbi:putative transmembrane protein [Gregarina niphandrodes]|uniref:Transmembrane protein n=1 Tax=Gregarina niphandrodes TaxID=110365 RepID=A0A023B8V1_GRENI|nr:putative transmembrane protein [Gregarina niphandrodes]EZG70373.1 putative transmembrane protein [Gregarina niphandrodes]|eukprot:XP_011129949.1 putative transmembrane protein [Gregarina niphandrodes]